MPTVGFEAKETRESLFNFPSFKLAQNENARICIVYPQLTVEYAHWAPDLRPKSYICLGDYEKLKRDGDDKKNCPFCRVGKARPFGGSNQPEPAVALARRYFVTHIIRYQSFEPRSLRVKDPLAADILVWRFADGVYNRLVTILNQYDNLEHGFAELDLVVQCKNAQFAQYEIQAAPNQAAWMASTQRQATVKALMESVADDRSGGKLEALLGRRLSVEDAEEKVKEALGTMAASATRGPGLSEEEASVFNDDDGVPSENGTPQRERPVRGGPEPAEVNIDDILGNV
jgi:hypothetical protein